MLKFLIPFILVLLIVIFWESYFGKNILGYGGVLYGKRLVSFFKDEPIVGGYINSFYLIIVGYLFYLSNDISNRYKYILSDIGFPIQSKINSRYLSSKGLFLFLRNKHILMRGYWNLSYAFNI